MTDDKGPKPVVHTKKHMARLERERRQTRIILYTFIAILVVSIGLLIYGYLDVNYFKLQKPVAKVGSVEITRKDFQTRVKLERNSLLSTYNQYSQFAQLFGMDVTTQLQQIETQLGDSQTLGQGVIDSMVNEELIRQEAAKRGITVSDAELEESVQGAFQFYPNGSPTPTVTVAPPVYPTLSDDVYKYITATPAVTATLEATATPTEGPTSTPTATVPPPTATATIVPTATIDPNAPTSTPEPTATPYTLEGFNQEYEKGLKYFTGFGLNEEQYRDLHATDLLRKKLYEQVTADVPAVEEQVWARHILVTDEASAQAVLERLNNGEDFGALAAELSLDSGSGAQGGDLGWFGKGAMVPTFEEAAFSLKIGEISAPVQSDYGYHIIQVIARQERPLTAEELQTARDSAFSEFMATLRTEYSVEIMEDWLAYVPTEPSFISQATEAAVTQAAAAKETQQAK